MKTLEQTGTLRKLLLAFYSQQDREWRNRTTIPAEAKDVRDRLLVNESSILVRKAEELESLGTKAPKPRETAKRRCMFLPPLERDAHFVPVLYLPVRFEQKNFEHRFAVALYCFTDKQLNAIAFRFEPPEGKDTEGKGSHNYYHAQLLKKLTKEINDPGLGCPSWLPATVPCLPLASSSPVASLLCLYLSLYGLESLKQLVIGQRIPKMFLKCFRDLELLQT